MTNSIENVYRGVVPTNITNKFREAFESDPVAAARWSQVLGSGDIIAIDGNAAAASYLVISKDPLTAGTVSTLTTGAVFDMPFEMAAGLHMSQRTLGQEFSVEFVSDETPLTPPADIAISSISQATTTLTVNTVTAHNLRPGMRIGIRDCTDSRMNYPALVVATTPTTTQFTATAGPSGTIASVTAGPFTSGSVFFRSALGYAPNGTSMIFENATATNASFYVRSEAGDVLPSGTIAGNHSTTILTTASVQAINAALTYSFQPTNEFRLTQFINGVQWSDIPIDAITAPNNRAKRTQVVPDSAHDYRLRIRATNNASLTRPNAQIVSAAKAGSTTATVITATPHGLTTGDVIVTYGVRDQTNFANLTTATAVASVVDATTFTVVWGASVTATSYGGYVARVNGGNLMSALGAIAQAAQSIVRTSNILTVTGSAAWSGLLIGDYVNLVGCRDNSTGATLGIDGAYRVRDIATTSLVLEPINSTVSPTGIDIGSTNCGGAVIKRTDLRLSFVRVIDFERQRVEILPRPSGDIAEALPVTVQNSPATTISSGTVTTVTTVTNLSNGQAAHDAAIAGSPHRIAGRALTANYTAVASGDVADLVTTTAGSLIVKPYAIPEQDWNANLSLTTTTAQAAAAAAGAGLKRHITALQATNTGTANDLIILDGVTERWRMVLPQNVPVSITFPTGLIVTANTALNFNLSVAGTVRVTAQGYTAP